MSKFKVGDLVVTIAADDPGPWRLKRFDGDRWTASDDSDSKYAYFLDSWILGYADSTAPSHYTPDASGKDYLARCEETYSRDEMIGAYRFTIGKYVDRMGKKQGEPIEKELDKIIEYSTRAKQWLGRQS